MSDWLIEKRIPCSGTYGTGRGWFYANEERIVIYGPGLQHVELRTRTFLKLALEVAQLPGAPRIRMDQIVASPADRGPVLPIE
jgi:hypothetical protein